ncbi:MAG: hypothetical protein COV66_04665 [Nitrospinae bacterium CG11_big_fil_rev_8_21_14_0_20_45_15]|nr:MAG: hypothetical protein COV66_04665 [Nitrospinae bacterium CG11_big_fil_rev_8_21_14_0_20_45_15]
MHYVFGIFVAVCVLMNPISPQTAFAEGEDRKFEVPELLVEAEKAQLIQKTQTALGKFEATKGTLTVPSNLEAAEIIQRTPGGVNVVDAKAFEDKFAINFEDTLTLVPGVFATKRFGEEVRISIRGSGLERSFHQKGLWALQDGVPFNAGDGSGDFQEVDNLTLQRMEVYKGGNAMQYGGTMLGGAIDMISKTGQSDPGHRIRLDVGSDDTYRTNYQSGMKYDDSDSFFSLTGSMSDDYRRHADQYNIKLNTNYGKQLSGSAETRFYFTANHINLQLPGTVTLGTALSTPRAAQTAAVTDNQQRDINSYRLSNKTTLDLGDGRFLNFGGFVTDKSLFHPITSFVGVIDQDSNNYGVFANGNGSYTLGGFKNEYRAGITTYAGYTDAKVYKNIGGNRGALTGDSDQFAANVIVYGENHLKLTPELTFILGGQYVWSLRDVFDRITPTESDSDTYESFNPRVGAMYQYDKNVQFFANATKSYEAPDFSNLTQGGVAKFVRLEAQEAWTLELGGRGQSGRFGWDVSVYRAWMNNEFAQFTTGGSIPSTTFNADETIHQGLELGLNVQLANDVFAGGDSFAWNNSYTYSDFRFAGDAQFGNNTIAGMPPHFYRTEVRYDHREDWHVALKMDVVSSAMVDYNNTFSAPGYSIFGFETGYDVNDKLSLFFTGKNLLNEEYVANFSTAVTATSASSLFYAGDGRRFFAGMRLKL